MSRDEDCPEGYDKFERICAKQQDNLARFRDDHPDIASVIGAVLDSGLLLIRSISLVRGLSSIETHRWMMWQTVFDYQQQSVLLIAAGKLDVGLALIRMAAELARDVAVIGDREDRLDLWFARRKPERFREYKRIFRFDDSTPMGSMARRAYDLCSEFGIHGHVSDAIQLEAIGKCAAKGGDEMLVLAVSDDGILDNVRIWLGAFAPLQHLCAMTFDKHFDVLAEPVRVFWDMANSVGPVLEAISIHLQRNAQDPVN